MACSVGQEKKQERKGRGTFACFVSDIVARKLHWQKQKLNKIDSRNVFFIKMLLSTIAERLNFAIWGDGSLTVTGLRFAGEARTGELAIARTRLEAERSLARAVLIPGGYIPRKTVLLYSKAGSHGSYAAALAQTAHLFIKMGEAPNFDSPLKYGERPEFPGVLFGEGVVIGEGTVIGPFTAIGDKVVIGRSVRIANGVTIGSETVIGDEAVICTGARIASPAFFHYRVNGRQYVFTGIGRVQVGNGVTVGSNSVIQRGTLSDTIIGKGTAIGDLVVMGHDAKIGENCVIVSQAGLSGEVILENRAAIYGQAGIAGRIVIGAGAVIISQSRIGKNVPPGETISGSYNRRHRDELRLRVKLERMAARSNS